MQKLIRMTTQALRPFYLPLCLLLLLCSACREEHPAPQKNDGKAPAPVSQVQVQRLPGGVRINYNLPKDVDLFYVQADCPTAVGNIEAKASFYDDAVTLMGFGDTSTYTAKLYAVDRSENKSAPVSVTFKPLLPPVLSVKNSLVVKQDFGGVNVNFTNPTESDLVIYVLTPDSAGNMTDVETYYTSRSEGSFSVRGFPAVKRKFELYVRDQWDNKSDTLVEDITPLFEEELDKSKFREYRLPGDAPAGYGWVMPRLWDGSIDAPNGFHTDHMGTTANPSGFPHHYTFDLGVTAKLSRFKFWQRGITSENSFLYAHGNLKKFQIWGSNAPAQDGSWDGWIKLLDCASLKPSGLPIGQVSNEDREYASKGEEYIFPLDAPAVRYIRVQVLSTWGGDDYSHVMEMTFWGSVQ